MKAFPLSDKRCWGAFLAKSHATIAVADLASSGGKQQCFILVGTYSNLIFLKAGAAKFFLHSMQ